MARRRLSAVETEELHNGPALVPFSADATGLAGETSAAGAKGSGTNVVYADINGDGLVDLVTFALFAPEVRPGNGRGRFDCIGFNNHPACDPTLGSSAQPWLGSGFRLEVPDADTWFPPLSHRDWQLVSRQQGVDERLVFDRLVRIPPPA